MQQSTLWKETTANIMFLSLLLMDRFYQKIFPFFFFFFFLSCYDWIVFPASLCFYRTCFCFLRLPEIQIHHMEGLVLKKKQPLVPSLVQGRATCFVTFCFLCICPKCGIFWLSVTILSRLFWLALEMDHGMRWSTLMITLLSEYLTTFRFDSTWKFNIVCFYVNIAFIGVDIRRIGVSRITFPPSYIDERIV